MLADDLEAGTRQRFTVVAKPDLDDGWFMLAYELVAAVMVAQIPKEARVVLFEVFAQIYGKGKAKTAHLSPTEIARSSGLAKSNVARGIAFLLKNGLLRREGLDAYRFVKDYESWGCDGEPLLTPKLGAYAFNAPRLAKSTPCLRGGRSEPEESPIRVIETDNPSKKSASSGTAVEVDALSGNGLGVIETDNAPPYRENRELQQQQQGGGPFDSPAQPVIETDNAGLEPFEAPAPKPIPPPVDLRPPAKPGELRRPFTPDPVELDRITTWVVDVLGNDNPAAIGIGYVKTQFPLDWIEASILEGLAVPNIKPTEVWRYASRCLAIWWEAGARPRPEVSPPRVYPSASSSHQAPRLTARQEKDRRVSDILDNLDLGPRLKETS